MANNVHTIPHLQNRVKYMHQALFCPPTQTLINAANLGFLDNIPFLTPELILKHLEKSPATAKGRMKLHSMGLRSTRRKHNTTPTANNLFCFAALADKQNGTFYTDCTGNPQYELWTANNLSLSPTITTQTTFLPSPLNPVKARTSWPPSAW